MEEEPVRKVFSNNACVDEVSFVEFIFEGEYKGIDSAVAQIIKLVIRKVKVAWKYRCKRESLRGSASERTRARRACR